MLRVVVTGSLGSGKSTVAARLRERGWPVLDADAIGHDLLAPGQPAAAAVAAAFGTLDRARLGELVFADDGARLRLNAILHPPIRAEIERRLQQLDAAGAPVAAAEIALYFETGAQGSYDRVIAVICDPEVRLQRLAARNGMARAVAQARLAVQLADAEKARRADFVVDNSASLDATRAQVDRIVESLCAAS